MPDPALHNENFIHIRIIVGMMLGLSISRLISGLARFIQHPGHEKLSPIHLVWSLFLILSIIHFWWFEFSLSYLKSWRFEIYFFVLFYAILFFLISSLLFPDQIRDYANYDEYFKYRRGWFYGLLCLLFLIDLIDTSIKGMDFFRSLGPEYPIRQGLMATGAILAIYIPGRKYQTCFAFFCLFYELNWILRLYSVPR